jgi:hypothetical protein
MIVGILKVKKRNTQILRLLGILLILTSACVTKKEKILEPDFGDIDIDLNSIGEIKIGPISLGEINFMTVHFEGQIIFEKLENFKHPSKKITVYRDDKDKFSPKQVNFSFDEKYYFSEEISLMVCIFGDHEYPHWPIFTFQAKGCKKEEVRINKNWTSEKIKMSCPKLVREKKQSNMRLDPTGSP